MYMLRAAQKRPVVFSEYCFPCEVFLEPVPTGLPKTLSKRAVVKEPFELVI
jgi:hypothetical protein